MALELIGGAVLGAGVSELLKAVIHEKDKAMSFKPCLEQLKKTLESVIPRVEEIKRRLDHVDKRPELERLIITLTEGKNLVEKCSAIPFWNISLKNKRLRNLYELDKKLLRFFQLEVQAAMWCEVGQVLDILKMGQSKPERAVPTNRMITTPTASINSIGGVGENSLSQGYQKDLLNEYPSKRIGDTNSSSLSRCKNIQLVIKRLYSSHPPICKAYGTMCLAATTIYHLGLLTPASITLIYPEVWQLQVWKLAGLFFLGKFSINFAIRLLMIAIYGVQLEAGRRPTADFLWMMIFGSLSLLVFSIIPPFRSPFLGTSLVYMLLYVRGRDCMLTQVSILGVTLVAFYLPWVMLGMDVIFGGPLMPGLLGIVTGHLYHFLNVQLHILQTPDLVHEIVCWRYGNRAYGHDFY